MTTADRKYKIYFVNLVKRLTKLKRGENLMQLSADRWLITENKFEPAGHLETCFTLANGYLGVRGTSDELYPEETSGTYLAGVFDTAGTRVPELVNLPYFFGLRIYIDGVWLDLRQCEIIEYQRSLDLKQGVLFKSIRVKDKKQRITKIEGYRFVSSADRKLAGMSYQVTCENYSGYLMVESFIDGSVINSAKRPREKAKLFNITNIEKLSRAVYLEVETRERNYRVGTAAALKVKGDTKSTLLAEQQKDLGAIVSETAEFAVEKGGSINVDKYIVVVSSRKIHNQKGSQDEVLKKCAWEELKNYLEQGIEQVLQQSIYKYNSLWEKMQIEIEGDLEAEKLLHFNMYHLLNCANPDDEWVSIAAKGLHGEGYKGHVFWDTEIFMVPFFIYSQPETAKALLMYRYHLLDAARANADKNGFAGAQYPWESADTGEEETPQWMERLAGEPTRIWTGDIEHHITADVALAVWEYYRATDDLDFLLKHGQEIIIETARFWASRVEYNRQLDQYEINDVIGPDEFHIHIDNNSYTNYLARWNLLKAVELMDWIKTNYQDTYLRLASKLNFNQTEPADWFKIADKIYIPYHEEKKLLEQFAGYFQLKDYLITDYDQNNMPIWPEKVDQTSLNDYTLLKQPDVVMLMHLLEEDFARETRKINFNYYEKRTMHKSSLSPSIYSLMGLKVGEHQKAYANFMRSARVDLADNQGNTIQGLHAASCGGTWQAAVFGFGGMAVGSDGILQFSPTWLPEKWGHFKFRIHWKKTILEIRVSNCQLEVEMIKGSREMPLRLYGKKYQLSVNKKISKNLNLTS